MIRILIVDDHQIIRNGIKLMLRTVPEFNVIAEAENGIEAVSYTHLTLPTSDLV